MKTEQLSRELTQESIDRVRDNNISYYLKALLFAENWVANHYKEFSSEDLKEAYYIDNEPPFEPRVWGAIIRKLAKNNRIFKHDIGFYKNPKGHGKPIVIWISMEFRKKQQSNALNKTQQKLFN